jgi:hypothetical protein
MLKIEGQNFQEPEFTAKTQNRSARFLELVKAQNRKTSSRTFKNSMLKTEGQNFQNPKLKAKAGVPTRFYNTKLKAQKSMNQISEPRN